MRVCPKCKYVDPPYWKHVKYSYWIDSCSRGNFSLLHPTLAKQLKKASDTAEDDLYVYRLTRNETTVERKAKVDFLDGFGWTDGTEKHEHFPSKPKSPWMHDNPQKRPKLWQGREPYQKKLLEKEKKLGGEVKG